MNSPKLNWLDRLNRKHEFFTYGDNVRTLSVEHEGRTVHVLLPSDVPPFALKAVALTDEVLFLIGEEHECTDEDGTIRDGGDGVLLAARKPPREDDGYRVFVWHFLFPQALKCLDNDKE